MMRKCGLILLLCLLIPVAGMADKTFTVTMTGDITLGGENNVQKRPESFTEYYDVHGPDYFLANIRWLFETDDVTFINLEGTLTDSSATEKVEDTYRFRAPTAYVSVLTGSSVELCNLSNNHLDDFGYQGTKSTKDVLLNAEIDYVCYGRSWICEKDGLRIGFVGVQSSDMTRHAGWMQKEVRRLKNEENCNAVIVAFHAGQEYARKHQHAQTWMATEAINAGADFVVMHHPHILEGCDIINSRYVFYSLGNFCFGGNNRCYGGPQAIDAYQTAVVRLVLTFSDDGTYLGQQVSIYPYYTSATYPSSNFQPTPVTGQEALDIMARIQYDTSFQLEPYDETLGCVTQPYLPADGAVIPDVTLMPAAE